MDGSALNVAHRCTISLLPPSAAVDGAALVPATCAPDRASAPPTSSSESSQASMLPLPKLPPPLLRPTPDTAPVALALSPPSTTAVLLWLPCITAPWPALQQLLVGEAGCGARGGWAVKSSGGGAAAPPWPPPVCRTDTRDRRERMPEGSSA
eukprot:554024-Pelagomonas_calceolata.AAC.3